MSDEMNVKISDIKAKFIKDEAKLVDKYFGNNDGKISKEEGAKLAQVLSGDLEGKKNQKKLAKESDEVKAIFGLNVSTPAAQTQAAPVETKAVSADATYEAKAGVKPAPKTPFEEVKARFLEVMEYDEVKNTSNGTTAKEAYKAVKKEFKGKGKEYKEAIEQLKDYAKHDFVNMRAQKTRAAVQAYDSEGNLVNADNLKYDTSRKVYNREKELTKANNNGKKDKWAKKAIRNKNTSALKITGRYLSGNASAGKVDDRAVAAGNRAVNIRENKTFTKDELVKALGKDNPLLQEYTDKKGVKYENVLVATGLITVENGKYKVKELSKVVGSAVGADNTLNDHDNHNEGEIQAVLTNLYQSLRANGSGEFYTSQLKDSQVRDLVEFLGYEDDRAKLFATRLWQNIWKGAGRGAVAGAAAGAACATKVKLEQHQRVEVNLNDFTQEQRDNFIKGLKSKQEFSNVPITIDNGNGMVETKIGNIVDAAGTIIIAQDQMMKTNFVRVLKSIALGALTGAGTGAVLGVLETFGSHAREEEIWGQIFDCDSTYEEIIDTIDHAYSDKELPPATKDALKTIAELGIVKKRNPETGVMEAVVDENCKTQWDLCQFLDEYNKIRGNKNLNGAEARAAARTADLEKPVIPECPPEQPVTPPEEVEQSAPKILWAEEITPDDNMNVRGHSWDSLAALYDCFPADKNKAKRMLKIMQGMRGTKLTVEQITELADISRKEVSIHYKRQNGKIVKDKYGNPVFDVEDAARQLRKAFENKLPEGYNFNYEQCARALCASVPGDDHNEIIAPNVLSYDDGRTCNKQAVKKPKADSTRSEAGNRGNAGKVGSKRNAVKDGDNPVQHDVSDKVLNEAKKKGKQDQTILNK